MVVGGLILESRILSLLMASHGFSGWMVVGGLILDPRIPLLRKGLQHLRDGWSMVVDGGRLILESRFPLLRKGSLTLRVGCLVVDAGLILGSWFVRWVVGA